MIEVTHAARAALYEIVEESLSEHPGQSSLGPRLVQCKQPTGENTLGLALDEARPDDAVVEHQDRTVLIVNERVAAALEGRTLDFVETSEGRRLTIR